MGSAGYPYQLHGGVILFPAPQHHAHLTSGQRGKGRGIRAGRGWRGRSTCPGAQQVGSCSKSSSQPRPHGHPLYPSRLAPRFGAVSACAARSPAFLAHSQPASLPGQIKQLPLRPSARALQRGGRWGRGGGGVRRSGGRLPAPSPPVGRPAWSSRLGGAG